MILIGLVALALFIAIPVYRDKERRSRVFYAMDETRSLREKVEAFHAQHQRWPRDALELGADGWTPYPDGGGYRLLEQGQIAITFSVLPELKGRGLYLNPVLTEDGKNFSWQCKATENFLPKHLPGNCRPKK